MKFFYILNNKNKSVEFGKITSERYKILKDLILSFNDQINCQVISINLSDVEKKIDKLIKEKINKYSDYPNQSNKFYEEINLFILKTYKNKDYKFCNTGFDNNIIFLINIYDSLLKDEKPYQLLFTSTHNEFNEWQSKNIT
ncbi:hypothetical protein [Flavobacterium piscisymbiosum]|uniref:DUF695 domain-containing protein n=1 Tax=Flavobacterium piscisymbiosum TaxID=2893753 RepID=A0ABS8MFL2_9FLAO|nr:hypothetical protein [Flavobacterium sp. F-30]MCC9064158.1 hypothetical protein [Flavobacterium sp. F-30]